MEARIKSGLWVQATLRQCGMLGLPAVVVRRGDPDSAAILVKLLGRAGSGAMVLSQMRTSDGRLAWMRATGAAPVPEPEADAYVSRQLSRDPDLWVIEIETADFAPPFEARIV